MVKVLPTVEVAPRGAVRGSVIWLHGLGADGHDFEPLVPHLGLPDVRFVFPHAPRRPVTINMGLVMPAWFDIRQLHAADGYDLPGIKESDAALRALVAREVERGVPAARIVLAGFSQGGAIALYTGLRYPDGLAGILALSTFLVEAQALGDEASAANRAIPIFQAHGTFDPMLPLPLGAWSHDRLKDAGYAVAWHTYPMAHEVSPAEIRDVAAWLAARF